MSKKAVPRIGTAFLDEKRGVECQENFSITSYDDYLIA